MQDAEMLIPLAEIAGVFVGFGALIAVRSGGPTDPLEVAPMRVVVSTGMLAIVAGLAPGALGRFDLTEHAVWALSSAVVLAVWVAIILAIFRAPESRAVWAGEVGEDLARPRWVTVPEWIGWGLYMTLAVLTPLVIIIGVVPELEAALYYAYAVVTLLVAGWALLLLVFLRRRPVAA